MLINDYNSLVKNNKNSHDKGIEFIDETFSMEYDNDRLYVNYHSLDIEILKDEATLNKFKANALAQAKQFDIDNIIHFYEDYYEEILETCVYVKEAVEL
jgi:hypothetical protein